MHGVYIGFILGGSAFVMLSPKPIFGVVGSARPRETRLCLDRPIISYNNILFVLLWRVGWCGGCPNSHNHSHVSSLEVGLHLARSYASTLARFMQGGCHLRCD